MSKTRCQVNFLTLAFGSSAFGRWIWLEDFLWSGAAVTGWDVGQMVLKADLQSLFPSNLDLTVGVLIFSVGANDRRISEAC